MTVSESARAELAAGYEGSRWGYRHQQCLVLFVCLTTAYSMRTCMGVALVAMVDDVSTDYALEGSNNTLAGDNYTLTRGNYILAGHNYSTGARDYLMSDDIQKDNTTSLLNTLLFTAPYPTFSWSKKVQDAVQSSFFWGYMMLQLPAGQLVHRLGARRLLAGALAVNCVGSFVFPWAAHYGTWICAMICRLAQGLSQACIIPALHSFFGKWTPLEERARLAGFTAGGQALGTVLGLPITGFIASSSLGWPGIFRFYGILSGLVAILVFKMVADTPAQHPKITIGEKQYIQIGLGQNDGDVRRRLPIPWAQILRCRGMHAIVIAHIGQTWGQLVLFAEVPAFMNKVMKVNIKANGLLTALPFLVMWFTNFFFMWFTDMLIVKKVTSPTNARKIANSIGCVPAAIGLVTLAYIPKNIYAVEAVLVLVCAFKISAHVGFMVNHIDISPNFAGTMMSISNFASNSIGSQAPMVAGLLINDVSSEVEWRKVFLLTAALYFCSNVAYVALGTAERAPFDTPPTHLEPQETHHMLHKDGAGRLQADA